MPFDYKKEYREYYQPPRTPSVVTVPPMQFIAVRGSGDPNEENGAYQRAVAQLYAVAFTLKMSPKAGRRIDGYFAYVVPPLEGFWRQEGAGEIDYAHKERFRWVSAIRLPDFVGREDFVWAVAEAEKKKRIDLSAVELLHYDEGLCVQCLHVGPYDGEPATIRLMNEFVRSGGYALDITPQRPHHEIYLSDPQRVDPARLRTVLRHPVHRA